MSAPQWTLLAVAVSELITAAYYHGKVRPTGPNCNFWHYLAGFLLYMAILVWGGFFK